MDAVRPFLILPITLCGVLLGAGVMGVGQAEAQSVASVSPDMPAPMAFNSCIACHTVKKDAVSFGPNLRGVVGRKAGSLDGYQYSAALKAADFTWDAERLDAWISGPKHVVSGTKMPFPGLPAPERRQEIIAYLSSLK